MLIPRISVLVECCSTAIQSQKNPTNFRAGKKGGFFFSTLMVAALGRRALDLHIFGYFESFPGSGKPIRKVLWGLRFVPSCGWCLPCQTTPRAPTSVVYPPGGGVTLQWGYTVALHTRCWEGGASSRVLCAHSHTSSPSRQQFLSLPFSLCCAQIRNRLRQLCFKKTPLFPEPVLRGD